MQKAEALCKSYPESFAALLQYLSQTFSDNKIVTGSKDKKQTNVILIQRVYLGL